MPEKITKPSVYTKILLGSIPGVILSTSKSCFSILTNKQAQPGHALIIPKKEVLELEDLTAEEIGELGVMTSFISEGLKRVFSVPKIGLLRSGFEISHYHQHLIPVKQGKEISIQEVNEVSLEERKKQGNNIQEILEGLGRNYKGIAFDLPKN